MAADKEEIKSRNDIVDVISAVVPLKKKGKTFAGLCPFHQEKTPSFNVDPTYQTFKCYGCGEGGDVFTFIEKHENMSFVEAAEFLARRAGLTFERKGRQDGAEASERERLFEINALASRYYVSMLDRVAAARDYLLGRGLTEETIKRFHLGYALDSWDALSGYIGMQKKDMRIAEKAGLVRTNSNGAYSDVFRNRLMFPIYDEQERVVGFGGRAFGDDTPKYLNTGDTPVFTKSRILYALPFARRKIGEEKQALLMEGYTDVIAAHQAGFVHAVATLGTSLTDDHAVKLARLAPTVVLVYDADSAGVKATLRTSEILEKEGLNVRVARLPDGEDPDTLIKGGGAARFQEIITGAKGRVEYQLDRVIAESDHASDAGREQMMRKIVAILSGIQTRSARDVYVNKVWKYHAMSAHGPSVATEQLHRDAEAYASRKTGGQRVGPPASGAPQSRRTNGQSGDGYRAPGYGPRRRPVQQPPASVTGTSEDRAEQELIRALADPEWSSAVISAVRMEDLPSPLGQRFYRFVAARVAELQEEGTSLTEVLARCEEEGFSLEIRQLLQEISAKLAKEPVNQDLVLGCAATLQRYRQERLQQELGQLLQTNSALGAEDQ